MTTRQKIFGCWLNECVQERGLDGSDIEADLQIIYQEIIDDLMCVVEYAMNLPENTEDELFENARGH